jgi:cupin fold WbuC family metalloprotein
MNLHKVNDEVFVARDPIVRLGDEDIAFLKHQAQTSARKRARICAHRSNDDLLHEMVIAISAASYIHPHRHLDKSESFHIVEGQVDVAVFSDTGEIVDVIQLGEAGSGREFYYRLSDSAYHTLLIRTDYLVVHEVTNGPFDPSRSALAPFAPTEDRVHEARAYMARVADEVANFLRRLK